MNTIIKLSVILGVGYVTEATIRQYMPSYHQKCKMKLLYWCLRTYSKGQIYYNKTKLYIFPIYNQLRNKIFGKPALDRPNGLITFFSKNNLVLSEYEINPEFLPIQLRDKGPYEPFNKEKLVTFIENMEPNEYEYYAIINKNNKMEDIIVRSYPNRLELDNIIYSRCEFLVLEVNSQGTKSVLNLVVPESNRNYNIINNRIDENFFRIYQNYENVDLKIAHVPFGLTKDKDNEEPETEDNKIIDNFNIFYVDNKIESNTLLGDEVIVLQDEGYKLEKKNLSLESFSDEENFEMIEEEPTD